MQKFYQIIFQFPRNRILVWKYTLRIKLTWRTSSDEYIFCAKQDTADEKVNKATLTE